MKLEFNHRSLKFDPYTVSLLYHKPENIIISLRYYVLPDFSLTVKAATLIFISGRGSAISSA